MLHPSQLLLRQLEGAVVGGIRGATGTLVALVEVRTTGTLAKVRITEITVVLMVLQTARRRPELLQAALIREPDLLLIIPRTLRTALVKAPTRVTAPLQVQEHLLGQLPTVRDHLPQVWATLLLNLQRTMKHHHLLRVTRVAQCQMGLQL